MADDDDEFSMFQPEDDPVPHDPSIPVNLFAMSVFTTLSSADLDAKYSTMSHETIAEEATPYFVDEEGIVTFLDYDPATKTHTPFRLHELDEVPNE